jgi:thioredoxin reductase (NADPH)
MEQSKNSRKIIIVGSGPAGLTAAIYSARGGLKPLVIEGFQSGGQLMLTTEVENFPGFEHGVMGPQLMTNMRAQAVRFGAEFVTADATQVDLIGPLKKVWVDKELFESKTVILSTGASANLLGLKNESRLMGKGVSTCATCDGFFFKNKIIGVVGGGDSAMEEANYLSRFGSKVYLIHRRNEFKASKIMYERAKSNPKIEFITNVAVEDVLGEAEVKGVKLKNNQTGLTQTLELDGLFVAIGHTPNSKLFKDQIRCDEKGYVQTNTSKAASSETNIPGVFACGDLQDSRYRQAITAAGSGCMAALDAEHFLLSH